MVDPRNICGSNTRTIYVIYFFFLFFFHLIPHSEESGKINYFPFFIPLVYGMASCCWPVSKSVFCGDGIPYSASGSTVYYQQNCKFVIHICNYIISFSYICMCVYSYIGGSRSIPCCNGSEKLWAFWKVAEDM